MTSIRQTVLIAIGSLDSQEMAEAEAVAAEIRGAGLEVAISTVAEASACLRKLESSAAQTAVVVIGRGVGNAVPFARQIRSIWPLGPLIFAPDSARLGELKRELSRTPLIGMNWSLAEPGTVPLPKMIVEAARADKRRAKLRKTLDRANLQIGTPRLPDTSDYRRLVISDHYLRNLLEQAPDPIISLDSVSRILYWSHGAERLFGLAVNETQGLPVSQLPFWTETLTRYLDQARNTDSAVVRELEVSTSRGPAQVELVISSVRDQGGVLIGLSLVMRDITARNEALQAERTAREKVEVLMQQKEQQRRLFNAMLSSTTDQGYVYDLNCHLQYGNPALAEQLELDQDQLLGRTPFELGLPPEQSRQVCDHLRRVIATKQSVRAEVPFTAASGREWFFEYIFVPVIDDQGEVEAVAGTTRDISQHKEAAERVWREANYDALTGLPNRRLFRDRLESELKHAHQNGRTAALLFIDLDRFKQVNDLHGHSAGDHLLKQAAARISACVRESDTVARLGGDEFTVILSELDDEAHVESTAQQILDQLALPFKINGAVSHVSGSIGITLYPEDALEAEDLIKNADQAMYIAKNNGRSRFSFFTRSLQVAALSRLKLLADLRQAITENQLELYFQPIVRISDGKIVKAEALLRWHHPTQGLLLPDQFIPLAEETAKINRIGRWVFSHATSWSSQWSELLGRTFQVSINQSPIQFQSHDYRDWIEYLEKMGVAANSISIEITEGLLLNVTSAVADRLLALQKAGVELAIDDFGTGYSSMAYLKKFAVDYLKIDKSFIRDIETNDSSRAIAESTIVMAHKLGLKVIAEGVETAAQKEWLRSVNCDYAQGFLYSKPVPPAEFEQLLKREMDRERHPDYSIRHD